MGITVRRAEPQDLDWLISQLREFSRFFASKHELFGDEEYARPAMLELIDKHVVMIAAKEDGAKTGFIAGIVIPHMFNPKIRVLAETFWWVAEEFRGTRAGLLLLNEFIAWGKANVDWITCALEAKSPINERALTNRGFRLQERSYLLEV